MQSHNPLARLKGEKSFYCPEFSLSVLSIFHLTATSTLYTFTHIQHTTVLLYNLAIHVHTPFVKYMKPTSQHPTPPLLNCAFHLGEYHM